MNGPKFYQDNEVKDSSWKYFPTEDNPFGKYKYYSFHPKLDPDLKKINRKTDSLLEWMGDVGGLYDGLSLIVKHLIDFYQVYFLKSQLVWFLV